MAGIFWICWNRLQARKAYVKKMLTRAVTEMKAVKAKGLKRQTADDFIREIEESV